VFLGVESSCSELSRTGQCCGVWGRDWCMLFVAGGDVYVWYEECDSGEVVMVSMYMVYSRQFWCIMALLFR